MIMFIAFVSDHNELVISRADLATLVQIDESEIDAVVQRLVARHWITASAIDQDGSVSEYHLNAQVVWTSRNNNRAKAKFSRPLAVSTRNPSLVRVHAESRKFIQVFKPPAAEKHRPSDTQPHQAAGVRAKFSMSVRNAIRALSPSPDM
ncbi:hypothetical protein [Variovorax sp. OV329]|uniref:hypothetical protein n=1 Tax=Variovorax sp. OV329 TaxID=1882825 RepID=UPI001113B53F|nr:hypothetical protein [Variovorax sp. OV329]